MEHFDETGARPDRIIAVAASLDEARAAIPEGCVLIARSPDDDPVIVESWI